MDAQSAFEKYNVSDNDIKTILTAFFDSADAGLNLFPDDENKIVTKTIELLGNTDKMKHLDDKCFVLKKLGKSKEKEGQQKEDVAKLENAAMTVISSNTSVGIVINKQNDNINFLINGNNIQQNNIESSLKAWVGDAEIKQFSMSSKEYKYCGYAKCIKFFSGKEQKTDNAELLNWASAVISSNIKSDYQVSVYSQEVDEIMIKKRIRDLSECYTSLEKLNEIIKNMSLNKNIAISEAKLLQSKVKDSTVGGFGSSNFSISLSHTKKSVLINILLQAVENKIQDLTEALSGGMKSITISCETDDLFDYYTITSIIKNSLVKSDYEVKWIDKKDFEPAIEILYKDIPKFFCLPSNDFPGFERTEIEELAVNSVDEDGELSLGKIYWNGSKPTNKEFTMKHEKLNRHVSVFGMTGSGKSTTVFGLLKKSKVPFLVIEPVKGEYRTLKKTYDDLVVYHMDADREGVLQINPFWFPVGGSLSFHMDALKKIISSAFSLYAAMPNILEQCIYNCYVKKGWNVVKSTNVFAETIPEKYLYPTFSDLCDEIELYLKKSDFQGETLSTYKGALLSRLKSFTTGSKGVLLNSTNHPDFDKWMSNNYVVELDGLADDADKSIVMGSLIMQYFQNVKKGKQFTDKLKHIIIVEEAHRLFKSNTTQSSNQEVAAPEAQLVGTLSNMMAEIRAYGEGFIIVDQSPNKVAEDVVSNSSTKIVHRLDNKKDIDMIENSLVMRDMSKIISGLKQGDAIVRTEGMMKPIKVEMDKTTKDSDYVYKQDNNTGGLDNASNVDFIMNDDDFCAEFVQLSRKFINQILYDDLNNASSFFAVYMQYLSKLLYLGGFQEIAENADKRFFLLLASEGIKKSLSQSNMKQSIFTLQMRMFADRLCDILADGGITRKEATAFTEFRTTVLHEQIVIKHRNGGAQEQGIAIACGFHTIYTDILSELMILINDKELDLENPENLTVEFFEKALSNVWGDIFIIEPEKIIKDNIMLLLRSLYVSISKK